MGKPGAKPPAPAARPDSRDPYWCEHEWISRSIKAKARVAVILRNSHEETGIVTGQDNFVIEFIPDGQKESKLIYKRAISSISPASFGEIAGDESSAYSTTT